MSQRFEADTGGKRAAIVIASLAFIGPTLYILSAATAISNLELVAVFAALIPIPFVLIKYVPRYYELLDDKLIIYYWGHWKSVLWSDLRSGHEREELLTREGMKLRLYRVKSNQIEFNRQLLLRLPQNFELSSIPLDPKAFAMSGVIPYLKVNRWMPLLYLLAPLGLISALSINSPEQTVVHLSVLFSMLIAINTAKLLITRTSIRSVGLELQYSEISNVTYGIDGTNAVFHFDGHVHSLAMPIWQAAWLVRAMVAKNPNIKFTVSKSDQEILRLSGVELPAPEPKAIKASQPTLP